MAIVGRKKHRDLLLGLAFLAPNILGFLAWFVFPLALSLVLAFSNWDLKLHNMFKDNPMQFVGFDNFLRLFNDPDFLQFFGNTLFLMMGIPASIAGSLCFALLLTRDMRGKSKKVYYALVLGAVLLVSCTILTVMGMGGSAMVVLLTGIAGLLLIGGVTFGSTLYRTVFFIPSFVAGVPVYILWKKLYNPKTGPINLVLAEPLKDLTDFINSGNAWLFQGLSWVMYGIAIAVMVLTIRRLYKMWVDGDLGARAAILPFVFVFVPLLMGWRWKGVELHIVVWTAIVGLWAVYQIYLVATRGADFKSTPGNGFGSAAMLALAAMVLQFLMLGFGTVLSELPMWAAQAGGVGLEPPQWLADYHWAKPAIMIMAFWVAIGSNNMLLYIAGLSNIPQELYEAADIDGAKSFQRFWNVTWPQLAPTTFFIVIMSVMNGLRGGFQMAKTMTDGGPAGATTTLTFFIYSEGFETGRLGYSSAIAWTLFAMIFCITMFNWKFGNRYVND